MKLRRYWIEFNIPSADVRTETDLLKIGCGVTGYSLDDCLEIMQQNMLKGSKLPPIKKVIEDVDISTLDTNHVLPNIDLVISRGIWFPIGYN